MICRITIIFISFLANLDQNAENDDDKLPDHPDADENTF